MAGGAMQKHNQFPYRKAENVVVLHYAKCVYSIRIEIIENCGFRAENRLNDGY